jgi:7-cyano-7-deazaguanine synthase
MAAFSDPPPVGGRALDEATAVLYSGGLDSAVLVAELAGSGPVIPIYVDCGLAWQAAEREAAARFLRTLAHPAVVDTVWLSMPVADVYGDHWSVSGHAVPDAATPDEAVYLPGRNALLAVKPLVWCGLHGIGRLALATLADNPFADATGEFRRSLSAAMSLAMDRSVEIIAPFAGCSQRDVMLRGRGLPLELTFSCIDPPPAAPPGTLHCGRCNKCAERMGWFRMAGLPDPTGYAI